MSRRACRTDLMFDLAHLLGKRDSNLEGIGERFVECISKCRLAELEKDRRFS